MTEVRLGPVNRLQAKGVYLTFMSTDAVDDVCRPMYWGWKSWGSWGSMEFSRKFKSSGPPPGPVGMVSFSTSADP